MFFRTRVLLQLSSLHRSDALRVCCRSQNQYGHAGAAAVHRLGDDRSALKVYLISDTSACDERAAWA